ncbi:MAG: hypothetical protein ACOC5T_00500 [Elusimicrobiota bacterium]
MEDFDDFLEGLDSDKIDNILSDSGDSFDAEPERIYDLYKKLFICLMHPDFSYGEGMNKFKEFYLDFNDIEKINLTSMFFTTMLGFGGKEIFDTFNGRINLEISHRIVNGEVDFEEEDIFDISNDGIQNIVSNIIKNMYEEMVDTDE